MDTKLNLTNSQLRFSIIGAGKVATALADKLQQIEALDFVFARNSLRADQIIQFGINPNRVTNKFDFVFNSNVIIIAVSDNSIEEIVNRMRSFHDSNINTKYVLHTSGMMPAKILSPLLTMNLKLFSAHPIQTFFYPNRTILNGITWGIENLNTEPRIIENIINLLDGKPYFIPQKLIENRPLYHLMSVVASNFVTTTIEFSKLIGNHLELNDLSFLSELIKTTVDNCIININTPNPPLTGPIARKDYKAIEMYLNQLNDDELKQIFTKYLEANINLMKIKEIYDSNDIEAIKRILKTN